MKITVEPERLSKLFKAALINGNLNEINLELTPNELSFRDASLKTTINIGTFAKSYFVTFEVPENEKETVVLTKTLQDELSFGFKDEKISFLTRDNNVYLQGSIDEYKEPVKVPSDAKFPIKTINSDLGVVPEKMEPKVTVLLPVENLKLPETKKFKLVSDGNKLEAVISGFGSRRRLMVFKEARKLEPMTVVLIKKYFDDFLTNFSGDVWLNLSEDFATLSQKNAQFSLTYSMGASEEE